MNRLFLQEASVEITLLQFPPQICKYNPILGLACMAQSYHLASQRKTSNLLQFAQKSLVYSTICLRKSTACCRDCIKSHVGLLSHTFAEVSNHPTKPFSLQKTSSLGCWETSWSDLLAKSTAGTGLPWFSVTFGQKKVELDHIIF